MKLKRRLNCKSYKEFCKIERKYIHWFFNKKYKKAHYEQLNRLWFVWIEYQFLSLEEIEKFYKYISQPYIKGRRNKQHNKTLKRIIGAVIDNYSKEFKNGKLIGFSITNEDYYYIYQNKNGKRIYDTCCSKIE